MNANKKIDRYVCDLRLCCVKIIFYLCKIKHRGGYFSYSHEFSHSERQNSKDNGAGKFVPARICGEVGNVACLFVEYFQRSN